MKTLLRIALALLVVWAAIELPRRLTAQTPPPSQTPPDTLAVVDQIGGAVHAVAIKEVQGCPLVFIGTGPRLAVVDACNPGRPREIGRSAPLSDVVLGVALSESHAFVAAGRAGLRVYDVSDPARPIEVGALDTPPDVGGNDDEAIGLAVDGSRVYVALGARGVAVVDVSDPAHPRETGRWHVPFRGTAFAVAAAGGRVYVANGDAGLAVLDASDPARPREIGALDRAGGLLLFPTAVVVSGSTAYIAGGPFVWAIDVSDPTSLRPAGPAVDAPSTDGRAMALAGTDLFVARVVDGRTSSIGMRLQRIDARVPAQLRENGQSDIGMPRDALDALNAPRIGMAVAGGFVWMANASHGLEVVEIDAPPSSPTSGPFRVVVGFGSATYAEAVTRRDDLTLVPNGDRGVQNFSLGTGGRLRYSGAIGIDGYAMDVAIQDDTAFIAAGDLFIADVSQIRDGNPILPLGKFVFSGGVTDVAVRSDRAYVADLSAGVQVLDVSDPRHPKALGRIPGIDRSEALAIDNDRLAVATGSRIAVFGLTDPDHPSLIAIADTPGLVEDVALSGDDIFVAGDGAGFTVLRLTDGRLMQLSNLQTDIGPRALAVGGDRAYLAAGNAGVFIVDISRRDQPRFLDTFPLPGEASGVAIDGDRVLVAARGGGLYVLGDPAVGPSPTPTRNPNLTVGAWLPYVSNGHRWTLAR